jgi:cell division protease FtsH
MGSLGPIAFGEREEHIFLGRDIVQHIDYSEKTAQEIDTEVRRIVDDCYERAKTVLEERIDVLHAMAKALLERETLDSDQIKVLLEGGTLEPFAPHAARGQQAERGDEDEQAERKPSRPDIPGTIPPLPDPGTSA